MSRDRLLGISARLGETGCAWLDSSGEQLGEDDTLNLQGIDTSRLRLGVACARERQHELESWLAGLPEDIPVWTCSWPDAALAGAFRGKPGLLLSTEHWSMYSGCACENGPEPICQALVMAREPNHRTLALAHGEGGLEWLSREGLKLLDEVQNQSRHPIQRALGAWAGARQGVEPMRERAYAVRTALQELADYPGPEPASLALLTRAGRRLSDLLRRAYGRVNLGRPARAGWLDGPLHGPLWEAMSAEFRRYLPELRWQPVEGGPALGCAWLVLGALKEEERRALNPNAPPAPLAPERRLPVEADAWRQLARWR